MNKFWFLFIYSVFGAVLGFLAGPGIAWFMHSGCVIDVPSNSIFGLLVGQYLGRWVGRQVLGRRLTVVFLMIFVACFALYLSIFAPYWYHW